MKKSIRITTVILTCLCFLLQTGCWDQKQFEEIGFILQTGLELDKEGNLLLSVTSPVVAPDVQSNVEFLYTSSEKLIRSAREKIRDVSGRLLQGGKIQLVYFSKDLAQKGINEFFEVYLRDPENPLLANVVVVDGSPKEMFEFSLEYKDKPRPSFYVNNLLQDARRRSSAPESRIYNFSILTYSKTIDPVAPIVRYDKKNIKVEGTALFSGDKMVGQIDTSQTILLNILIGNKNDGEYAYNGPVPDEDRKGIKKGAEISLISAKRKIKVNIIDNKPTIDVKLQLKAVLDEFKLNYDLENSDNKKKLEDAISQSMEAETHKLIQYMQGIGSDPVGFGEIVRSKHNSYWKSVNWKDVFKDAMFNIDITVNIDTYGTIK